jgi:1-acyl-sn-glycerol-3-phosphate acyltransferase
VPEEARNGTQDAVVIPIGTGGRPGRGSGSARPSSAARNLAPSAKSASKPAPKSSTKSSAKSSAKSSTKSSTKKAQPPRAQPEAAPTEQQAVETPPTTGIPVGEWLSALQGAAHEVFGDDWERRLAELMAFVRRRLEGDYEVDDYGFDRELTERFFMAALRPIAQKWFRLEVRGLENIPTEGGALVVSNHSGTVPLDGLMTMLTVHDHTGRFLRPLGADLVFRLPVVSSLARKGGATLACIEDAERMLSGGDLVGVWPEGFKGIGKPFSERYKLQRFGRGGFVSAALRTGVPIIPLSVVGAEEIYPLVGNVPSLARLLGVPYIPITPFFPWLGPLGLVPLPSKWILEFGEPIRTDSYDSAEAEDPMLVFNVTDQVRETIQHTLFDLLRERDGVFS